MNRDHPSYGDEGVSFEIPLQVSFIFPKVKAGKRADPQGFHFLLIVPGSQGIPHDIQNGGHGLAIFYCFNDVPVPLDILAIGSGIDDDSFGESGKGSGV